MPLSNVCPAPKALTLDLDDTLWPVRPVLVRAEQVLNAWLRTHAPATARAFDAPAMMRLRVEVGRRHPELVHDLTELRLITLREALAGSGEDPALAGPAFDVFFAERQRVQWYDDVRPALERLAARFPLLALTNGNAELQATGLAPFFAGVVNARGCGVAKPDPRIFHTACAALGCAPEEVLHVGDDWHLDVLGARAAGLHTAWVRRPDHHGRDDGAQVPEAGLLHVQVADLTALADAL